MAVDETVVKPLGETRVGAPRSRPVDATAAGMEDELAQLNAWLARHRRP